MTPRLVSEGQALRELVIERIRTGGPLSFAEFMDLALYHPDHGYYTRAARRSGREGDFFTSVDVGPVFGTLLSVQIAEMHRFLAGPFDLVEAGAADGRLARDLLDALAAHHPTCYEALRLHLIERSPAARAVHRETLGPHSPKLVTSSPTLPPTIEGILLANELLDALPVHVVVATPAGLREMFIDVRDGRLVERLEPPSTPALEAYFARLGLRLEPGWRAEVNLAAVDWMRNAARALVRGFLLLIDYGHDAAELYSAVHAAGTLTSYCRHRASQPGDAAPDAAAQPAPWLEAPGTCDLTSHVDFTTMRLVGEEAGLVCLGLLDQTYFLLGLGAADELARHDGDTIDAVKRRLAVKTLLLPGGLGSTHKVLVFARGVGTPPLRGLSYRIRTT